MVNNGGKAWKREPRTRWTFNHLGGSKGIVDEIEPLLYPSRPGPRSITCWEIEKDIAIGGVRALSAKGSYSKTELKDNDKGTTLII